MMQALSMVKFQRALLVVQQHGEMVREYLLELPELLKVWENASWQDTVRVQQRMWKKSMELKELQRQIRTEFTPHCFHPFSSIQIKTLMNEQTQIVVEISQIVELVIQRKIKCPATLIPSYFGYLFACSVMLDMVLKMFGKLNHEGAQPSPEQRQWLQKMWLSVAQVKEDITQIHAELLRELSHVENSLSVLEAVFLHQIFERTNHIAAKTEQVGLLCLLQD